MRPTDRSTLGHSVATLFVVVSAFTLGGCNGDPFGPSGATASLAVGLFHSCSLQPSGTAWCWGSNLSGQIGDGAGAPASTPLRVDYEGEFVQLAAGFVHSCALNTEGDVLCWGDNSAGELGDQTTVRRLDPVSVAGGLAFDRVVTGGFHSCGLTEAGIPYCWGANSVGQLGVLHSSSLCAGAPCELQPTQVEGGLALRDLSAGYLHTCGLTSDGAAYCWGSNNSGQLGNGFFTSVARPVLVTGDARFTEISAGRNHTCALTAGGEAYCWGLNVSGQLGVEVPADKCYDNFSCTSQPVAVESALRFKQIAAGGDHTCAVTLDNVAYCWGRNDAAQLGVGSTSLDQIHPLQVSNELKFAAIGAGDSHTCALTTAGEVYCWGDNLLHQMGQGAQGIYSPNPILVTIPEGP